MTSPYPLRTALVVDPCPETQAFIAGQVEGRGYFVMAAADPAEALRSMDLTAPDIVITDLFLPDGAGLALAKEISSRQGLRPVIVMGTDGPDQAAAPAIQAGAVDYLHKPVAGVALAQALQRALARRQENGLGESGILRSDCSVVMESDPAYISEVISWLMRSSASTLQETQQSQLRGSLYELLFNAIEHGNLEILYEEKQQALAEDRYEQLLEERLAQVHLKGREVAVHVRYDKAAKSLEYRITDEGRGFNWRSLFDQSQQPCRTEDANGRGIFLARSFFPNLSYNDRGNEVTITVPLA